MTLSPAQQKFVLHWGEMGTRWGINRTVAQIHALLFISPRPLNAEELTETLQVARSNVSTSIRELQGFGLVRMTHVLGDRRDYFESEHDVWELFRVILEQRKQRELNPTLAMLRGAKKRLGWMNSEEVNAVARDLLGRALEREPRAVGSRRGRPDRGSPPRPPSPARALRTAR